MRDRIQTGVNFSPESLGALVVATSFAAGLNVYLTVFLLGLLDRLHWIALPGSLGGLHAMPVLVVSGVLFLAEFVADKVPGLDLLWNALHTFVRVPVAGLLAWQATSHLSPGMQLLSGAAGAGIALLAHGSKTAARAAVLPSPEPVSNIALSTAEDAVVLGLVWLGTHHPIVAGGLAVVLLLLMGLAVRWLVRGVRETAERWRRERWRMFARV